MTRDASERLQDLQDALGFIRTHVGGSLAEPRIADALVLHAVFFNLIVIGEAAKSIDDEPRGAARDVPWSDYAGLRDVIAHQYFRVQTQIIENTVRRGLPEAHGAITGDLPGHELAEYFTDRAMAGSGTEVRPGIVGHLNPRHDPGAQPARARRLLTAGCFRFRLRRPIVEAASAESGCIRVDGASRVGADMPPTRKSGASREKSTPAAGFEPATCGLEVADLQRFWVAYGESSGSRLL